MINLNNNPKDFNSNPKDEEFKQQPKSFKNSNPQDLKTATLRI